MAHKKSGGAKARQGSKPSGKRLGVKLYGGQKVTPGKIIIRQRGTKFQAGVGTGLGRDDTIFSKTEGTVKVKVLSGKKIIEVQERIHGGS
jgi:large subunit ribosomal protein L27